MGYLFLFHAGHAGHAGHTRIMNVTIKLDLPHHAPPFTQFCFSGGIGRG